MMSLYILLRQHLALKLVQTILDKIESGEIYTIELGFSTGESVYEPSSKEDVTKVRVRVLFDGDEQNFLLPWGS